MKDIKIWSLWVSEFKEKIKEDYIIIDVRTFMEVQQWRLECMDMIIDCYLSDFTIKIDKLDRNKKYLLYCRSGSRTWMTLNLMKDLWFKEVYDLWWWIINWLNEWEKLI